MKVQNANFNNQLEKLKQPGFKLQETTAALKQFEDPKSELPPSSFLETKPKLDEDDFEAEELREEKAVERPLWKAQARLKEELKHVDADLEKRGVEPESFLETPPKHWTKTMLAQLEQQITDHAASLKHAGKMLAGPSSLLEEQSTAPILTESLLQELPPKMRKVVQAIKTGAPSSWVDAEGYPAEGSQKRQAFEDLDGSLALYSELSQVQKKRQDDEAAMLKKLRADNEKQLADARAEQTQWEHHHTLPGFPSSLLEEGYRPSRDINLEGDQKPTLDEAKSRKLQELLGNLKVSHPETWLDAEGFPKEPAQRDAFEDLDSSMDLYAQLRSKVSEHYKHTEDEVQAMKADAAKQVQDAQAMKDRWEHEQQHFAAAPSSLLEAETGLPSSLVESSPALDLDMAATDPVEPAGPSSLLEKGDGYFDAATLAAKKKLEADIGKLHHEQEVFAGVAEGKGSAGDAAKFAAGAEASHSLVQEGASEPEDDGDFSDDGPIQNGGFAADYNLDTNNGNDDLPLGLGTGELGAPVLPPPPGPPVKDSDPDLDHPPTDREIRDAEKSAAQAASTAQAESQLPKDSNDDDDDEVPNVRHKVLGDDDDDDDTSPGLKDDPDLEARVNEGETDTVEDKREQEGMAAESRMHDLLEQSERRLQGRRPLDDSLLEEKRRQSGKKLDDAMAHLLALAHTDAAHHSRLHQSSLLETKPAAERADEQAAEDAKAKLDRALDKLRTESAKHIRAGSLLETEGNVEAQSVQEASRAQGEAFQQAVKAAQGFRRELHAAAVASMPSSLLQTGETHPHGTDLLLREAAQTIRRGKQKADRLGKHIDAELAASLLQTGGKEQEKEQAAIEAAATAQMEAAAAAQEKALAAATENRIAQSIVRGFQSLQAHKTAEMAKERGLDASLAHLIRINAENGSNEQKKRLAAQLFMKTMLTMQRADPAKDPQDWQRLISMLQDDASQFRAASLAETKEEDATMAAKAKVAKKDTPSDPEAETDYAAKYRDVIAEPLGQLRAIANRYKHESDATRAWLHDETGKILAKDEDAAPSSLLEKRPHHRFVDVDTETESLQERQRLRHDEEVAKEAKAKLAKQNKVLRDDAKKLDDDVKKEIPLRFPEFTKKSFASSFLQAGEEPIDRAQHKLEQLHEKFEAEAEHFKSEAAKDAVDAAPSSLLEEGQPQRDRMFEVGAYANKMSHLKAEFARDAAHIRKMAALEDQEDAQDPESFLETRPPLRQRNPFAEPLVLPKLDFSKLEHARTEIAGIEDDVKKSAADFKAETQRENGLVLPTHAPAPPTSLLETGSEDPLDMFRMELKKVQDGMAPENREFQPSELSKTNVPLQPEDPATGDMARSVETKIPVPKPAGSHAVPYVTADGKPTDKKPEPSSFLETGPTLAQAAHDAEELQKHMRDQMQQYRDNAEHIREKSSGPSIVAGSPGSQLDSLLQRVHETTSAFKEATAEESQLGGRVPASLAETSGLSPERAALKEQFKALAQSMLDPSSLAELSDHPKLADVEKKFKAFADKMASEASTAEKQAREAQDRLATTSNELLPSSFVEEGSREGATSGAWQMARAKQNEVQELIQRNQGEIQQWQQNHAFDSTNQQHYRQIAAEQAAREQMRAQQVRATASKFEYDTAKWRQSMEEKEAAFKSGIGSSLAQFEQRMHAPMRQLPSSFAEIHASAQANASADEAWRLPPFKHGPSLTEQKFQDDLAAFRTHVESEDGPPRDPADYVTEPTFGPTSSIPADGVLTDDAHTFEGATSLDLPESYLQRTEQLRSEAPAPM
jgi:hypothetical protein